MTTKKKRTNESKKIKKKNQKHRAMMTMDVVIFDHFFSSCWVNINF